MREIKFRAILKVGCALSKDDPAYYETIVTVGFPVEIGMERAVEIFEEEHGYHVIKLIAIVQYTGLKDSKGVEIYEGDIIRYYDDFWSEDRYNRRTKSWDWEPDDSVKDIIIFNESDAQFYLKNLINNRYWPSNYQELEVIGNIWENEELLE